MRVLATVGDEREIVELGGRESVDPSGGTPSAAVGLPGIAMDGDVAARGIAT
jgi:hypothetical protein